MLRGKRFPYLQYFEVLFDVPYKQNGEGMGTKCQKGFNLFGAKWQNLYLCTRKAAFGGRGPAEGIHGQAEPPFPPTFRGVRR